MTLASNIENIILNYFSEIIYTNNNPFILKTKEVFKINGIIEYNNKEEVYNLNKYQLANDISSIKSIIMEEMLLSNRKAFNVSKNIFTRLTGGNKKNLLKELSNLSEEKFIISSTEIFNKFLTELNCNIIINDNLMNSIIVGDKSSKFIIKLNPDDVEISFDKSNYFIIEIN
jgi:hypothetical protein